MKNIGPYFYDELVAYGGLIGEHFTWSPNGSIEFFDDTPQSVIDGVNAVYAAHDPDGPPPITLSSQSAKLQQSTQLAAAQKIALAERVNTLNDAVELEMATPEEAVELPLRQAQLLDWKRYAVYLGRVTTQEGWHEVVEWPAQPAKGMDLTVSAVSSRSTAVQ